MAFSINDISFMNDQEFLDKITLLSKSKPNIDLQDLFYLGQHCNNKVSQSDTKSEVLNWLESGLIIFEMIRNIHDKSLTTDIRYNEMNIRFLAIKKLGKKDGDKFLDPITIKNWFVDQLYLDVGDAKKNAIYLTNLLKGKSIEFSQSDLNMLRELQKIKSSFSLIDRMVNFGLMETDERLISWKGVCKLIP